MAVLRSLAAQQDLSVGAMDKSFEFNSAGKLKTVYIHSSVKITEEVSISLDSVLGSAYDTLIDTKVLSAMSDYVFAAPGDIIFNEGDKIRVQVTDANSVGLVAVTVKADYK